MLYFFFRKPYARAIEAFLFRSRRVVDAIRISSRASRPKVFIAVAGSVAVLVVKNMYVAASSIYKRAFSLSSTLHMRVFLLGPFFERGNGLSLGGWGSCYLSGYLQWFL